MGGGSAKDLVRWVRTLHESGAIGGLSDAGLVERFVSREGTDREDAFSVLVHRHGSMVQRVCRRMLSDPADADDAFQAVFLVLARKAGALRRVDNLQSWLYAVAVRTSLEARKRSARLRAKEGAPLDDSLAAVSRDEPIELRALLDEELHRLPNRFREPLLLCELEGLSRQAAARRLGLPEGTLSSRLARGRSLLRDRLTRRGVAVGALGAIFPAPATVAATLDASLRLALKFAARDGGAGTVPAAVASLAEGVIPMFQAAKLKTILLATSTLVAACMTAGLVAGQASPPAEAPQKAVAQAAESVKQDKPREPLQARGAVVDESGNPVVGAKVRVGPFRPDEGLGVSGPDGAFAIPAPKWGLNGRSIVVGVDDGRRLGVFQYGYNLTRAQTEEPARVVVKPSREITVHVADSNKAAIEGAVVEVVGEVVGVPRPVTRATTGADGAARVWIPIDSKVCWIVAKKGGAGFDYAEFGKFDDAGRPRGGVAAERLADSVELTLESPRVVRIQAVDQDGKPMAGVGLYTRTIQKTGRRTRASYYTRLYVETTDADGIATFDWLPSSKQIYQFFPVDDRFARRRAVVREQQTAPAVVAMIRNEAIRGRVVMPDGSPAPEFRVYAGGVGASPLEEPGGGVAITDENGYYEVGAAPNQAYVVSVENHDWAAPARFDVVVRPGKPVSGVDFQVSKGTLVTGVVTIGEENRPAAEESLVLVESCKQPPAELRENADVNWRWLRRSVPGSTDAEGRYAIRVGAGTYTLMGPARTENETITIADQPEIVRDFHMAGPKKGPLSGRVIDALDEKPVAGARVEIVSANRSGFSFTVTADEEGRFQATRDLDKTFLCAWRSDGALGGFAEIGPEPREVVIAMAPTASATGRLLDEKGEAAKNQELKWGRRVYLDERELISTPSFAFAKVATDENGRFTLPSLVVGQRYDIGVENESGALMAGVAEPQTPGPLDLGTLRVGAYKDDDMEDFSSFLPSAPDAGAVAPEIDATTLDGAPLALKDFAGKYVLLDFWATWCGPCLIEIPSVQEAYDAFGEDRRFVILSLSIDETIDEPRKFQKTRKLPWNQGHLKGEFDGPKAYGVRAIPAYVLIGPDGKIIARGMRGEAIKKAVAEALDKAD